MKKKNKNNLMVAIVAIILVTFTACGNTGKKDQARQSSEQDQGLTKAEIMQQYFPLKIGNSWTYKREVKNPENVYTYSKKTTTEAGWDIPKGTTYFTVEKPLIHEKPGVSHETYTITGNGEYNYFMVKVTGESKTFRDGRYGDELYEQTEPNIRWKYVGEGMWELINGYYGDSKTDGQTWMTVLNPDKILCDPIKEGEEPLWMVGATMYKGKLTVPAGTFSDILENITIVGGSNIDEILTNDDTPMKVNSKNALGDPIKSTEKNPFGCYMVKSYYAKGVGLILEIQLNPQNQESYRLELEKYEIK